MADKDTPGNRWTSDPDTVEVADRYAEGIGETNKDVAARTGRGEDTPRRYDEDAEDDVTAAGDSSLNTKI